ncbi:hypothetical protein, partial [Halalkalibacillus halophilus]|uniref:hypothetical protein n=1 Tax=Halalkalibacillus halophilus TaxID=392827 RepID=UPI0005577C8F
MKWKLRIPMILFIFGFVSGIYQYYSSIFITENYLLNSIQFLTSVGIPIYILEKTKINEKKVSVAIGLTLILAGVIFDYVMVKS